MEKSNFPLAMKSMAAIVLAVTLILALIYHRYGHSGALTASISFGTTAYHLWMRLAVGAIVPKATDYNFDYHAPWFQPRNWEAGFYQKLRVKSWKEKLPTYAPEQFSLKSNTPLRVIQNMCGAEIVHEIIMALSFLPLAAVPVFGALPVFLITSALAALIDSTFVIAQRFNRPRLVRIYEKTASSTFRCRGGS